MWLILNMMTADTGDNPVYHLASAYWHSQRCGEGGCRWSAEWRAYAMEIALGVPDPWAVYLRSVSPSE